MAAKLILGYAYLKVNFDIDKKNAIDLILPLCIRALESISGSIVSAADLQNCLSSIWGLKIPENVIRFMIPRLVSQGFVSRAGGGLIVNKQMIKDKNFDDREVAAGKIYDRVRSGLQHLLLIYKEEEVISPDEVIERFLDRGNAAFLSQKSILPVVDKLDTISNAIIGEYTGIATGKRNIQAIEDIDALAIGDILYKAISSISESDIDDISGGKMQNVDAFLDTGVVLDLYGYNGEDLQKPAQEMIHLARVTGCQVSIFRHTLEEARDILRAAVGNSYSGFDSSNSSINRKLVVSNKNRSDIIEDIALLENILVNDGIIVKDTPNKTEAALTLNESKLDTILQSRVNYKNPSAKIKDIESLTAIFRMRRALPMARLEQCEAIFITSNQNLAAASTEFFKEHFREESQRNIAQLCMTEVIFTTRLWIKVPTEFANIPRNRLIAHSLASLKPPEAVVQAFLRQLEELQRTGRVTEEEAVRARFGALTTSTLMLESRGMVSTIDAGSTDRMVRIMLENFEKDKITFAAKAVIRERKLHDAKLLKSQEEGEEKLRKIQGQHDRTQLDLVSLTAISSTMGHQIEKIRMTNVRVAEKLAAAIANLTATFFCDFSRGILWNCSAASDRDVMAL